MARVTADGIATDLRRLLEPEVLPHHAADTAAHFTKKLVNEVSVALNTIELACGREAAASVIRENAGALVIRLIEGQKGQSVTVKNLSFPAEALTQRNLEGIRFERCHFQPTSLDKAVMSNVAIVDCVLERLDLSQTTTLNNVVLEDPEIRSVGLADLDIYLYDPHRIYEALSQAGFRIARKEATGTARSSSQPNEELVAAQRLFRVFLRATELNENVLKLKAGNRGEKVIDALEKAGVLTEVQDRGSGRQRRFRLASRMRAIEHALRTCDGTLDDFIKKLLDPRPSR